MVAEFGDPSPDHATLTTNPIIALLAVKYIKADVSGRVLIDAMSPAEYRKVLKHPDMQTMLAPLDKQG